MYGYNLIFTPIKKSDCLEEAVLTHTVEECGIIQHYKGSDHIGQSECHRVSAHGLLLCPTFFPPLLSFSTVFQMVTVIYLDRPSLFLPLFFLKGVDG